MNFRIRWFQGRRGFLRSVDLVLININIENMHSIKDLKYWLYMSTLIITTHKISWSILKVTITLLTHQTKLKNIFKKYVSIYDNLFTLMDLEHDGWKQIFLRRRSILVKYSQKNTTSTYLGARLLLIKYIFIMLTESLYNFKFLLYYQYSR